MLICTQHWKVSDVYIIFKKGCKVYNYHTQLSVLSVLIEVVGRFVRNAQKISP